MNSIVQVGENGAVTIPFERCAKYEIQTGDTFRLVDLDGVFVLTPMVPIVPKLARQIEQLREEAGLSIGELLQSLREQRERGSDT